MLLEGADSIMPVLLCPQLPSTDFCMRERLPTSAGLWMEEESDFVINGAPTTVMLPPLNRDEDVRLPTSITRLLIGYPATATGLRLPGDSR